MNKSEEKETNLDHYQVLGLTPSASAHEIKKAFKSLAQKYHPDKDSNNAPHFNRIKRAYDVLSDPQRKAVYDCGQRQGVNPQEFKEILTGLTSMIVERSIESVISYPHQDLFAHAKEYLAAEVTRVKSDKRKLERNEKVLVKQYERIDEGLDTMIVKSLEEKLKVVKSSLERARTALAVIDFLGEDIKRVHMKPEDIIQRAKFFPARPGAFIKDTDFFV